MKRQRGLSLLELLTAVLVVAILAAVAVPVFLHQRGAAKDEAAREAFRAVASAVADWSAGPGVGTYPTPEDVSEGGAVGVYAGSWPTCPYTDAPLSQGFAPGRFEYRTGGEGALVIGHLPGGETVKLTLGKGGAIE